MQIDGNEDPQRGAPAVFQQQNGVGFHEAVGEVPWGHVVRHHVAHVEEDAVHSWANNNNIK